MIDTQPFIDLGWHTVPLKGELKRLPNGKKTIPMFFKNWREQCRVTKVLEPAALGGAMTGPESGIIAIDCDNSTTYNIFKSLDPSYDFHFISLGKKDDKGVDQDSGTIIYKYTDALNDCFSLHNGSMSIDFYSSNGFIYLPTEANETKKPMDTVPELKEAPESVIALLRALKDGKRITPTEITQRNHRLNLAPMVHQFLITKQVNRALFKMLTPKNFRDSEAFLSKGYLHPNEVVDGRGSEYLSKVSAILGADASVNAELYCDAMIAINNLFDDPMPRTRLNATIIEPMINLSASIDGVTIWQEDENWDKETLWLATKAKNIVQIFYDDRRLMYYVVDISNETVTVFEHVAALVNHLQAIAVEPMSRAEVQAAVPNILAAAEPSKVFGFFEEEDSNRQLFNTFVSTKAYKVFKEPEEYEPYYKRPDITLKYIETLIPDPAMRMYLLGFLRRKLDTFDYSPVILYFLGVPGSGKDTFVNILERIIGEPSIDRPTAKVFLEKHNGWLLDKFFVQLDEYGDQLSLANRDEALGLLKAYTGKPRIQIRKMNTDGFSFDHNITFIMTANRNPLMLDQDDRRVALFSCPNKLEEQDWVYDAGGIETVIQALDSEVVDFCYYLSTELTNISARDYNIPPQSANKQKMTAAALADNKRIAYYLKTKNWEELRILMDTYGPPDILERADKDKLYEHHLIEMYDTMQDGEGNPKLAIRRAMDDAGFVKQRSSIRNKMTGSTELAYYYYVYGFRNILNVITEVEDDLSDPED